MKIINLILIFLIIIFGCEKGSDNDGDDNTQNIEETKPVITSITADKYEINVGGEDPALIKCNATGGNLNYLWEVDLGDIFVMNDDGSQVRFTGSECCDGKKYIKCFVTNSIGTASDTIILNIIAP